MITGEIIGIEETQDLQKNIIIWVQIKNDGIEIDFGHTIEKKKVWPLYTKWDNFAGKTDLAIYEWVKVNIEYQFGNIIKAIAKPLINTDLLDAQLPKLIGRKFSADDVSHNYDGTTITIKSDGTII